MPLIDLGDITLHYTSYGPSGGTPLLLIHGGWGLAVNGFDFVARTLADEFQLIVPDRRGYGQSTHVVGFDADGINPELVPPLDDLHVHFVDFPKLLRATLVRVERHLPLKYNPIERL